MSATSWLKPVVFTLLLSALTLEVAHAVTSTAGAGGSGTSVSTIRGGDAFAGVWNQIKSWTEGTLGKVITLTMILVGVAAGILRQSLIGLVVGIGGGVGLYNAPTVIDSIMGVTSSGVNALLQANNYQFWTDFVPNLLP